MRVMQDAADKKPARNIVAKSGLFAGMNRTMSIASMVMVVGFVVVTAVDVEHSSAVFTVAKDFIIGSLDWFYVAVVNFALFYVFWLLISRFGDVKLGKPEDEPDFSTFSWICMLFSAGLGSGLIYWGVAEPMYHIQDSPYLTREGTAPGGLDDATTAIRITDFHWGLHGWALYVLVGLSLAYFAYRRDLPLTLRTALYPALIAPLTILITVLLISWFVTSSDSGTLVICTMLSMGDENPPVPFRIFWGVTEGAVAAVLMLAGGLNALQTASIVAGLPIAIILFLMAYGMVKTLEEDFPVLDVEDRRELEYLNR